MAIYQAKNGYWAATQAEAKEHGGIIETLEVPSTKSGWLELLNRKPAQPSPDVSVVAERTLADIDGPLEQRAAPEPAVPSNSADGVIQWVLDGATNADIENIFAALGARFHEARRAAR